jgi:hypothetical protein
MFFQVITNLHKAQLETERMGTLNILNDKIYWFRGKAYLGFFFGIDCAKFTTPNLVISMLLRYKLKLLITV